MQTLNKILKIKGREIGGLHTQICMPIVAKDFNELMEAVDNVLLEKPDIVEWRVDYFENIEDKESLLTVLGNLREKLIDFPLIFTLRIDLEGGVKKLEDAYRIDIIKSAIKSNNIDMLDIELINGDKIKEIVSLARENEVYVIVSNHDFEKTPSKEIIIDRLKKSQDIGGDIAKIAVMANTEEDVLDLLYATSIAKNDYMNIPLVTMAMSPKGLISRLAGGIFGSSITFSAGRDISAPGQIPLSELRTVLDIIEKNS